MAERRLGAAGRVWVGRFNLFVTRSELLNKIKLGEDSFFELKEVRFAGGHVRGPNQSDLADEIAAFANSRGGTVLLGVSDESQEVLGIPIEQLNAVELLVLQACEDSIKPPLAPIIERLTLPDSMGVERPLIRIEVSRSLFLHQSAGRFYHRVGSSKRLISSEHLEQLFRQRSQARLIRFDETPVPTATIEDLQKSLWDRFVSLQSVDEPEKWLSKLAITSQDDEGVWRPTIAGVMMASTHPERFIPGAFIQAVAYTGSTISPQTESVYQRDAQDIKGCLDQQIFAACDFVRKNMRVAGRKNSQGMRTDYPQYDMLAVFEAITNAVAHRDYSLGGSKVRLRMFDNRLEIFTPGLLSNTMTPESLPYRQVSRNEAITSLLAQCSAQQYEFTTHRSYIMDRRGEGVPLILSRSQKLSEKIPEYQLADESELILTIYSAH